MWNFGRRRGVVYQVVGYYVTIGSVQVLGFSDVVARLRSREGPIAAQWAD